MRTCMYLNSCQLFGHSDQTNRAATMKSIRKIFCDDNFNECARYIMKRYSPDVSVPDDLMPDQKERAAQIISVT